MSSLHKRLHKCSGLHVVHLCPLVGIIRPDHLHADPLEQKRCPLRLPLSPRHLRSTMVKV